MCPWTLDALVMSLLLGLVQSWFNVLLVLWQYATKHMLLVSPGLAWRPVPACQCWIQALRQPNKISSLGCTKGRRWCYEGRAIGDKVTVEEEVDQA